MPAILQYTWLALTIVLTLTGLASIVEGFIIWADFFARIIDVYKATLRGPIANIVYLFWPSEWPRIPKPIFDIIIIWTAFFTALRVFWAREGKWLRQARAA
jgi:hypothetical protein